MATADFLASYDQILDKATDLDRQKDDIDNQLKSMEQQVQNLTSEGYVTPQASGALHEHYLQFTNSASQTIDHITEVTALMRQSVQLMKDTDAAMAQAANGR